VCELHQLIEACYIAQQHYVICLDIYGFYYRNHVARNVIYLSRGSPWFSVAVALFSCWTVAGENPTAALQSRFGLVKVSLQH
jgi:hypothetical protein